MESEIRVPARRGSAARSEPDAPAGTRRSALLCLLVSGAITFLLFGPALDAGFVAEDFESLTYGWKEVGAEVTGDGVLPGLRPGTVSFFALLEPLLGRSAWAYRAVVLLLHAGAGCAVFRLAQRTLRSDTAAALAAAVFLGAPVHPEAVVWIASAAGTVTSSALALAACLVWTREPDGPAPRDRRLAALLYLAALLFKETAAPLPLLLMSLDLALDRWRNAPASPARFARARSALSRYRTLVVALGVYLVALAATGAARSLWSYAAAERLTWHERLVNWSAYAHDLLRPMAPDKPWAITPPYRASGAVELWPLAIVVAAAALLGKRRWAALWTVAALAPGWGSYGERLTYLALAGAGFCAAGLLLQLRDALARHAPRLARPAIWRAIALGATVAILAADLAALRPELENWKAAGAYAERIPSEVRRLLPQPPPGAKLYFRGLVDNFGGAYSLRMGVQPELRRVYGDDTLQAFIVADRRPRGRRILLSQIPCDDPAPRAFFAFDSGRDELFRVEPAEFGVDCSGVEATGADRSSTEPESGGSAP